MAHSELARQQQLVAQGFVSPARRDDVQADVTLSAGQSGEQDATLRVADLSDRPAGTPPARRRRKTSGTCLGMDLQPQTPLVDLRIHGRCNPEGLTRDNFMPGLIGTILTMTMVMLIGQAMTCERERGTMGNPLARLVRPLAVLVGKILP